MEDNDNQTTEITYDFYFSPKWFSKIVEKAIENKTKVTVKSYNGSQFSICIPSADKCNVTDAELVAEGVSEANMRTLITEKEVDPYEYLGFDMSIQEE